MPDSTLALRSGRFPLGAACGGAVRRAGLAVLLAATATTACTHDASDDRVIQLRPFATTLVPLSESGGVALVSDQVACTFDSFESRIHCTDSRRRAVGAFGREGEGPGEFRKPLWLMGGPDGLLAAFDLGAARLTFFEPDGTLVSATRMPADVVPTDLQAGRVLGYRLAMLDRTRSEDQPDYVPTVVDASSGEILWEREDLADAVGRDCFGGFGSVLRPEGGFVTTACEHELVFLDHRDAASATVVAAPNYFPALPGARDVEAYVNDVTRIGGGLVSLSPAQKEAYAAGYREKPRRWYFGGSASLNFDGLNRLWAALTLDRDDFSYLEIWTGTEYAGTVRVRDRLMDYDILGATLVVLVERKPDQYGIAQLAVDWYDIDGLDF